MSKHSRPSGPEGSRDARLGAALRANLARRKAQARSRTADARDDAADRAEGEPGLDPHDNGKAGQNPHEGHEQD